MNRWYIHCPSSTIDLFRSLGYRFCLPFLITFTYCLFCSVMSLILLVLPFVFRLARFYCPHSARSHSITPTHLSVFPYCSLTFHLILSLYRTFYVLFVLFPFPLWPLFECISIVGCYSFFYLSFLILYLHALFLSILHHLMSLSVSIVDPNSFMFYCPWSSHVFHGIWCLFCLASNETAKK